MFRAARRILVLHTCVATPTCSGESEPRNEGCHGMSPVVELLPYVDYNNVWIVPVGHCLLFGVVSNFISHIFRPGKRFADPSKYPPDMVPHAQRDTIEKRGQHFTVPSEFGRKYKSVIHYRRSYTMEDWLHFVVAFSPYLFSPQVQGKARTSILPELLQRMWDRLTTAILHYFHAFVGEYTDKASQEAADSMLEFAKLVEQHFPKKYCTFNLHMAVCR